MGSVRERIRSENLSKVEHRTQVGECIFVKEREGVDEVYSQGIQKKRHGRIFPQWGSGDGVTLHRLRLSTFTTQTLLRSGIFCTALPFTTLNLEF